MESRTITQIKVHFIVLNRMTERTEHADIAAISTSKEKLVSFIEDQTTEGYKDDNWFKRFKKGSILEWFNPYKNDTYGHGFKEDWVSEALFEDIKLRPTFIAE